MRIRLATLAIAGIATATTAMAAPFSPHDVRAAGMGGAGVAGSKAASAALYNPAMLSAQIEGDKFQFLLGAGVAVADNDNLFDRVDDIQITIQDFQDLIATYNSAPSVTVCADTSCAPSLLLTDIYTSGSTLINHLTDLNNDSLIAGGSGALSVGVPGPNLGVGVFVTGNAYAVASPNISATDFDTMNRYASVLADGIVTEAEVLGTPSEFSGTVGTDLSIADFFPTSTATSTAVALVEVGVGLSHRFELSNGFVAGGATLKAIDATTFDYTADIDTWDSGNFDASNYEVTDSGFDVDLGAIYKPNAETPWQYGLTLKNVIGNDYKTFSGGTVEVGMQARAGIARMTQRSTVSIDLDLTKNDGITGVSDTQFLALGAEYDLTYLQLRGGLRTNLASSEVEDAISVGLGLGPVDLSVIGNAHDVGASLQLGFGW